MVNHEIVGYLEKWKEKGQNLSSIKRNLLERGFDEEEIDEAAKIVFDPIPLRKKLAKEKKLARNYRNKKILSWIFFLIAFVIFFISLQYLDSLVKSSREVHILDCGENFECFSSAAGNCSWANFSYVFELDFSGVIQRTQMYSEIKGLVNKTCEFYTVYGDTNLSFSEDITNYMKSQGFSEGEISTQLESMNLEYDRLVEGKNSTCYYSIKVLKSVLKGWESGDLDFSTEDQKKYKCVGSIYEI